MSDYRTNPNIDVDGEPMKNDSPVPGILWDKETGVVARYDEAGMFDNDDDAAIALVTHLYTTRIASGDRIHDIIMLSYEDDEGVMVPNVIIEGN